MGAIMFKLVRMLSGALAVFLSTVALSNAEDLALSDTEFKNAKQVLQCVMDSSKANRTGKPLLFDKSAYKISEKMDVHKPLKVFLHLDETVDERDQEYKIAAETILKVRDVSNLPIEQTKSSMVNDVAIFIARDGAKFGSDDFSDYLDGRGFTPNKKTSIIANLSKYGVSERASFKKQPDGTQNRNKVLRMQISEAATQKLINRSLLSSLGYACHKKQFAFETIFNPKFNEVSKIDYFVLSFLYSEYYDAGDLMKGVEGFYFNQSS